MKRGDIYVARLDPVEGSEQAGSRPVVIVSRNALNSASTIVVVAPVTSYKSRRRLYPSQVLVSSENGGLKVDSVVLCEQIRAIAKTRLGDTWGTLSHEAMGKIDRAILICLDLPGQ